MANIRKLIDIINETSAGATSSGSVSVVEQPLLKQSRVETPEAPQILEYGMWENSVLATNKKLKKTRTKARDVVKKIYGEDQPDKQSVSENSKKVAKKKSDGILWRVEQSEATLRYHVVKGHQNKEYWTNKLGASDFNNKSDAEAKANELNNRVDEGFGGAAAGAIGGAIFGKSPQAAVTGANIGSKVQDMFSNEDVAEDSLQEIGYADSLDDANYPIDRLLKIGKLYDTIEGNKVMTAATGSEKVYFLVVDDQVTAFLGFKNNHLKNIKNFTKTPGVIRALIGCLVHKHGQKIIISNSEPLTSDGKKWVLHLIQSSRGLNIVDQNGKQIDSRSLKQEWLEARKTSIPGPTSVVISENSEFGNKLRENESLRESNSLLMPYQFYDTKIKKQGVAEGSLNEGQYEMMMRNGQVKKFIAKDDADAKRIAAGHGAKSVIKLRGGVPAGKVAEQGVAEGWSKKYKRSIDCSHPKGFSQRAHCAGKKKHNESIEMEMICPDCNMCETHGNNMMEVKQRLDAKCWAGKHKEGTKIKGGVRVNNCVPNESVSEDGMSFGNIASASIGGGTSSGTSDGTKMFLETENEPKVRRYKDNFGQDHWEVLDWKGHRVISFTNRSAAHEYLKKNLYRLIDTEELEEGENKRIKGGDPCRKTIKW